MARLTPRVCASIRASIMDTRGQNQPVELKDICLGGVGLGAAMARPLSQVGLGDRLSMEVFLENAGQLTATGFVSRKAQGGVGISFAELSRENLQLIWGYTRRLVVQQMLCPYCGRAFDVRPPKCSHCSWELNFLADDYFAYWEKESLLRGLFERLQDLPTSELHKISEYIQANNFDQGHLLAGETVEEFVGVCPEMRTVFTLIRKVAPTELPVLILGESGTGKELTARTLYERSLRQSKPFVAINCAAIPESLIESELFGYEKGAFTGAFRAKPGKFEDADGGTIFLDEIGEFPLNLQPKLLRFLENQRIHRLGASKGKQVDVRNIAATNCDIEKAVSQGRFRRDLYHRINVYTIKLPPLRERGEDKVVLAQYFFKKIKMERKWCCKGFSADALAAIRVYPWPGNVREMINRIRRAIVVQDQWISPDDLELEPAAVNQCSTLKKADEQLRRNMLITALKEHRYNISQTARSLGISRPYVYLLIKKLDIALPRKQKA